MQMKEQVVSHNLSRIIPSTTISCFFSCLPVIREHSLSVCSSGGSPHDLDGHIPLCR